MSINQVIYDGFSNTSTYGAEIDRLVEERYSLSEKEIAKNVREYSKNYARTMFSDILKDCKDDPARQSFRKRMIDSIAESISTQQPVKVVLRTSDVDQMVGSLRSLQPIRAHKTDHFMRTLSHHFFSDDRYFVQKMLYPRPHSVQLENRVNCDFVIQSYLDDDYAINNDLWIQCRKN
jgi:hypothetical protein